MDPISLILAVVGIGLNAVGSLGKARAIKEESAYAAALDEVNAQQAQRAQADAIQRGQTEEGKVRMKASADISESRAAYGASGVDGSVGSPLQAMADARMVTELDAATIRNNAAREAWGYKVEETNYLRDAKLQKKRGDEAFTSTLLGGGSDLFSSSASLYSKTKRG